MCILPLFLHDCGGPLQVEAVRASVFGNTCKEIGIKSHSLFVRVRFVVLFPELEHRASELSFENINNNIVRASIVSAIS